MLNIRFRAIFDIKRERMKTRIPLGLFFRKLANYGVNDYLIEYE